MALRDFIASTSLAKGLGVDVLLKDGGVGTHPIEVSINRSATLWLLLGPGSLPHLTRALSL